MIPIIDLAYKLGMRSTETTERSAIVIAEVHEMVFGLICFLGLSRLFQRGDLETIAA